MKTQKTNYDLSYKWILGAFVALVSAQPAHALSNFNPGNLSGITSSSVDALLQTAAIGSAHRAYQTARPLGMAMGLDVGVDVTVIAVPSSFSTAMTLATQQPATNIPSSIPLPRLNIHKGLPMGIDIGFSYMSYQSLFNLYGGDIQWAFLKGMAAPNLAVRLSGNYSKLYFLSTHTYSLDVVASKNFVIFEPFMGAGVQYWSGDLVGITVGGAQGLPVAISGHQSGSNPRFFGGLAFKMLILKITAEADYNTAGVTTYGGKVSLNF